MRLELSSLLSSLLHGTRAMLVLNFLAFKNKKYTADDRFHGNGLYQFQFFSVSVLCMAKS